MKSFTDLEQSKKLAEILPIESADMRYHTISQYNLYPCDEIVYTIDFGKPSGKDIPCWSLAALLNYIKDKCSYFELAYISNTLEGKTYKVEMAYRLSSELHDVYEKEIIDACYKMILDLHELKLL